MRVLLLKGASQYDVLRHFQEELAAGFAARAWDVSVLDLLAMDREAFLARLAAERADLVFSFNIAGDVTDGLGRSVSEIAGAPHVVQLVDYPLSDMERFERITRTTALLTIDPSHGEAIERLFGPHRFSYVGFSPHGGMGSPVPLPDDARAYLAHRDIAVLFAGTYYRSQLPPWEEGGVPPFLQEVFREAARRALTAEWLAPQEAFDGVLAEAGIDLSSPDAVPVRALAGFVQEHIRQERRFLFLKAAARVGLPLTVVGKGYEEASALFPNMTALGPRPVQEVLGLMARSRIVANTSANFGRGSHERPLSAMRAGAVALSDHTAFFAGNFAEDEIALFRWQHLEDDLARLAGRLNDPETLFAMAKAGQAKAVAGHGWAHRIEAIIAAGKAAAANLNLPGVRPLTP